MADTIFCPKCGTANQADFKFCTSCGFDLSTISKVGPENTNAEKTPPPFTAPVQNQPAVASIPAKTGSAMPRWVPAAILIVIVAGIGYLIWNNERSKKKNDSGLTEQQTDNNGQDTAHKIGPVIPEDHIEAKDFAGVWRAYESNTEKGKIGDPRDDLFIEVSNGRIAIYPRSDLDKDDRGTDITCDEIIGNTISCLAKERNDEKASSVKLEMSPSKNEMTVTIIPPDGTETWIIKTRRLSETEN